MTVKEKLKPTESPRVIDLVAKAGVDVKPWSRSKKGQPVKTPASNPAYCYDWAFIEPGRVVVLNLWYHEIEEDADGLRGELNIRHWAERVSHAKSLSPGKRNAQIRRAGKMDAVIAEAFRQKLPVRVIVGEGSQEDITNPESKKASRMKLRELDSEPWSIRSYDSGTGACLLVRGPYAQFVDQYTLPDLKPPVRTETTSKGFERDRNVRDIALKRAKGQCELASCKKPGFVTAKGEIYLETHHVVPLSENGVDHEWNVAALCSNHHREAHHGEQRTAIRETLLSMLEGMYGPLPTNHN
ncbi:MAG: HNH endonuclease signature motif containing protein [Silvibacterium sp.]